MTDKIPSDARFEASTKTIRSVPGNHWLASIDSWDGAVDHAATAEIFARAFKVRAAAQAMLDTFGGDVPDWVRTEAAALAEALA